MNVFAVVDIGSNTVHLLVAASDGVEVRPLLDTSEHLRLGADVELLGEISPFKLAQTEATLRRYVARAAELGATSIRLLATQAVRSAANRDQVVPAIEAASGQPINVLEPEREAFYAVLGAALTRTWDEPHMVVDIGGASTQIVIASGESLLACRSVPIGSGRLASRFTKDPPSRDELAFIRRRVTNAITQAVSDVLETELLAAARGAVIVGGAMRRVARLVVPQSPLPVTITPQLLQASLASIEHQPAGSIAASREIEYDKVGMTRAGAIILYEVLRAARLTECTVSPFGIREGAILDAARTYSWRDAAQPWAEPAPRRKKSG